jgi:gas vesicle protein
VNNTKIFKSCVTFIRVKALIFALHLLFQTIKIKIMSSGKVLLGVLAGVAAGAALGILFAPDKGSATRKKISKKGKDYAGELEDKFNDLIDGITKKFETVKDETISLVENGKAKTEEAVSK